MTRHAGRTRFVCCALALVLLASLLGCTRVLPDPTQQVYAYFSSMKEHNYPGCYAMLDAQSKERMSMADFLDRHDKLYTAMKITAMTFELGAPERHGAYCDVPYTLRLKSDIVGDIEQELTMRLHAEGAEFKVEWQPGMLFEDMGWDDVVLVNTLYPKRGEILDSEANAFAINTFAQSVVVKVGDGTDKAAVATRLSPIIDATYGDIVKAIDSKRAQADGIAVLAAYLPGTLDEESRDAILDVPGVYIDEGLYTPIRYYPQGSTLAHMLGYTAPITLEQLKSMGEGYTEASRVGQSGLEAALQTELAGKPGMEIAIFEKQKDGALKKKRVIARLGAEDGADLELTIDYTLQKRAEASLKLLSPEEAGCVVVIDPRSGDVLAAASYPTFDLNMFTFGLSKEELAFFNDKANRNPLFNRSTRGLYPPGSTIKPFTAAFGLRSGKFTPQTEFKGKIVKKQWQPTEDPWKITRVSDYEGPIRMESAMINSDNIYFADIAMKLDWDEMLEDFKSISFNEAIDFDIPVQKPRIANEERPTNVQQLLNTGFGQGQMLVSPLQMACIFSAFANDGDIMRPRIVRSMRRMEGDNYAIIRDTKPEVWKPGVLSSGEIATIKPMLLKVMIEGSGKNANINGTIQYGKTGTAQLDGTNSREIAWIIAFTGNVGYERLVCVMLEVPANTGQKRHEIMKEMMMP